MNLLANLCKMFINILKREPFGSLFINHEIIVFKISIFNLDVCFWFVLIIELTKIHRPSMPSIPLVQRRISYHHRGWISTIL